MRAGSSSEGEWEGDSEREFGGLKNQGSRGGEIPRRERSEELRT